jgi:hypothetical protein
MKKILLVALCFFLVTPAVDAQTKVKVKNNGHYVKMKPKAPKYTKAVAPGDNYVYVREDWDWNPTTGTWVWAGNRWVETTQPKAVWVPGHWTKRSGGWEWIEGHWQ